MNNQLKFLAVNLQPEIISAVKTIIPESKISEVNSSEIFESLYVDWNPTAFDVILCGIGWETLDANEIGQNLKMKFRDIPLLFTAPDTQIQSSKQMKKNGFLDFFYWPMDCDHLTDRLRQLKKQITGSVTETLIGISTHELEPDQKLDFDLNVYFPMNKKYIKLSKKGEALTTAQLDRLKNHSVSKAFIPESQLANYHNYLANNLRDYAKTGENSEKLVNTIRTLFHELLTPVSNQLKDWRDVTNNAQKVVTALLPTTVTHSLFDELSKTIGDSQVGLFKRTQNVATIAGLLALGLSVKCPEDVVLAALFCDLGCIGIPDFVHYKSRYSMTSDEKILADSHITSSLQILADKKMSIMPSVRKIIQQHHEKSDGSGYPLGINGYKICKEAQILSLALQIESLTIVRPGCVRLGICEAIEIIEMNGSINLDLIREVRVLTGKYKEKSA